MKYNGIILSGLPKAGKSTLVEGLTKKYNWIAVSIGGMWRAKHKELYPHNEKIFEDWWRTTTKEENLEINRQARKIAEQGHVILDSRYSAFYCQDLPLLRVFLSAPLRVRAGRIAAENGLSVEQMEGILEQRDKDELSMGMQLYGKDFDYRSPLYYHLFLDTSKAKPTILLSQIMTEIKTS